MARFSRPRSLVGLMLMGFALVALPLIVAIVRAVIHAESLEAQSQALVEQAVRVARSSESLVSQVSQMERNARQYQVTGEPALVKVYNQRHERFQETLDTLAALPVVETTADRIGQLQDAGERIRNALDRHAPQSDELAQAMGTFDRVENLTRELNEEGTAYLDRELAELQQAAADTRQMLVLQSALAIPAALLLALVFTAVINRPISQLLRAIRRMGRGDFEESVRVSGPPELIAVSERLDWLRRRLGELEEQKSRFLRHMSHELKTPLASLREGTELMLDGSVGPLEATQREVAELLRANALELQQMIVNLLDFNSWQERTARLNITSVDLTALARAVADRHRLAVASRGLEIMVRGDEVRITADRDKLRTALDNLVSNAVKYSPDQGTINIVIRRRNAHAVIDVVDQGPGIPAADRERVFEPFFRGETSHAGPVKGTGIGLSVAVECIRSHGGTIEIVDSETGAHFRIRLPGQPHEGLAND